MAYPSTPFINHSQIYPLLPRYPAVQDTCEWLCETPLVTTIRVNLFHSNMETAKREIKASFAAKYGPQFKCKFLKHKSVPELLGIAPLSTVSPINEDLREVIVDCDCGASLLRGASIYAPGVLAMEKKSKVGDKVNVFIDLDGLCLKGTDFFESENKFFVGEGKIVQDREQIFKDNEKPQGIAVDMYSVISRVPSLSDTCLSLKNGMLQNLPSIICSKMLEIKKGNYILDMCASPGNKTTHLLELIQKKRNFVIAMDKTEQKTDIIRDKCEKLAYKKYKIVTFDARNCVDKTRNGIDPLKGPPFALNSIARILLDAPCSAMGTRPQIRNKITAKMMQSHPKLQKKLLANAVEILQPGGILIFSTCSITTAENEEVVAWALRKFPNIELCEVETDFGRDGIQSETLSEEDRKKVRRFGFPKDGEIHELQDTIGFFIAKFYKQCPENYVAEESLNYDSD